jgi:hypothetical protein
MLNISCGLLFCLLFPDSLIVEAFIDFCTCLHLMVYLISPARLKVTNISVTTILVCLIIALLGEIFLSLIWKVYDYRWNSIPIFVPPGHALLFIAGTLISKWVGLSKRIYPSGIIAMAILVGVNWCLYYDRFSVMLFALCLPFLLAGSQDQRKFYIIMLWLSLVLELIGTTCGVWRWRANVPFLGLTSGNPPVSAGLFYILLDWYTVNASRILAKNLDRKPTS